MLITVIKNKIKVALFLLLLSVTIPAPAQSANAMQVILVGIQGSVIGNLVNICKNAFGDVYNHALKAYTDIAYEFDLQIPSTVVNNSAQMEGIKTVDSTIQKDTASEIANSFVGIKALNKAKNEFIQIPAGDTSSEGDLGFLGRLFRTSTPDQIEQKLQAENNNKMFDPESLIGKQTYTKTDRDYANLYIKQLKAITPIPPIIHITKTFEVPIMNPKDLSQDTVTIGSEPKPLSSSELEKLKATLLTKQSYLDYINSYRTILATRNFFLDNIMRSFEERVPIKDDKSLLQLRNESIEKRLKPDYYKAMSTASPATVNREILFLLVELNRQMGTIREQNERLILLNSISALGQLSFGAKAIEMQAKDVGKLIYCNIPDNKDSTICTSGATSAASVPKI